MNLGSKLSDFCRFQGELFPALSEEVGPLLGTHRGFVAALDLVGVEGFVGAPGGGPGRPPEDRRALARAFLAKAVWDLPTTRHLIDRLGADPSLRRLCGWPRLGDIPSEATFSRAFAEFSASRLAERMHEALVVGVLGEALIGHVSRDSTAIEGREAAVAKPKVERPKRRPGRPRKGEERPKTPTRLERQADGMSLKAMLDDLPKVCDRGTKKNARGVLETWRGYKLHVDTADCGIPLSAILTSASLHDSQAAIPLATMTAERVVNLYDLMDAAYDATEIHAVSKRLGHIPVIDTKPPPRQGPQASPEPRGASPARRRPSRCPNRPIPHPHHRREDQRPAQGRVRRPSCPGARTHKGRLPSDVRSARTDRRPDHPPRRLIAPPDADRRSRAALPNGHGAKGARLRTRYGPPPALSGPAAAPKKPLGTPTDDKITAAIPQPGNSARGSLENHFFCV